MATFIEIGTSQGHALVNIELAHCIIIEDGMGQVRFSEDEVYHFGEEDMEKVIALAKRFESPVGKKQFGE